MYGVATVLMGPEYRLRLPVGQISLWKVFKKTRRATNENRPPFGAVWMTREIRASWIRIFLVAMKHQQNKLHWPYILELFVFHVLCTVLIP